MARKDDKPTYVYDHDGVMYRLVDDEKEGKKVKSNETFIFLRTSEDIDWTKDIASVKDMQVLIYMMYFHEKSNFVWFPSEAISDCAKYYKTSEKTISNAINSLIKTKFIKKIGIGKFLSNPTRMYNGGTNAFRVKFLLWGGTK